MNPKNEENEKISKFVYEHIEELVYIIDLETYDIIHANQKTKDEFGDIEGQKCYEVLQTNQKGPCPFCPAITNDKDTYSWENTSTKNNKTYLYKNKIIELGNNKKVKLQIGFDISKQKEIEKLAYYDSLTSLPNRTLLLDRINQFINISSRNKTYASLMFVDLDDFKIINDIKGHLAGDIVLKECARRFSNIVRKYDTVSRFGGDEFVFLINTENKNKEEAYKISEKIAMKILEETKKPFFIENEDIKIGASIGIVVFKEEDNISLDDLLRYADNAMYHSKELGRGMYTFFDSKIQEKSERKSILTLKLRNAIKSQKLEVYYQKQVDRNNKVFGVELFTRWNDDDLGIIAPDEFIPLAVELNIITKIDDLVLNKSFNLIKKWQDDEEKKDWQVSVNIDYKNFQREDFVEKIEKMIKHYGVSTNKLRIEITQNLFLKDEEMSLEKISKLKNLGINLSIDDFATGYFSLLYLQKVSVDEVKIDKSFIEGILENKKDEDIVYAILEIAKKFNFKVIVEGVETKEVFDKLLEMGCDNFQGFYFNKPANLDDI